MAAATTEDRVNNLEVRLQNLSDNQHTMINTQKDMVDLIASLTKTVEILLKAKP